MWWAGFWPFKSKEVILITQGAGIRLHYVGDGSGHEYMYYISSLSIVVDILLKLLNLARSGHFRWDRDIHSCVRLVHCITKTNILCNPVQIYMFTCILPFIIPSSTFIKFLTFFVKRLHSTDLQLLSLWPSYPLPHVVYGAELFTPKLTYLGML